MGVLLVGGMVFIVSVLWQKASEEALSAAAKASCPGGYADLTGRGVILESQMQDRTLRLMLEKEPGKHEILVLDNCTGKVISNLIYDTDTGYTRR